MVTAANLTDWAMDGHQLGPIREGSFDLNFGHHFRNSFHDIIALEYRGSVFHQLGHRPAVPNGFKQFRSDESEGLRVIQFKASGPALASHLGGGGDKQLLDFSGCQMQSGFSAPNPSNFGFLILIATGL